MPLYDHFHGPVARTQEWETFHTRWGVAIADDLNRRLPKQFLASGPMHHGVAVATGVEVYAPPATDLTMPATFPDEYKIEVRDKLKASRVIAVVELVSEANKKEASKCEQFAAKCLSYLGKGIGLVVIDIVTTRHENLHNEIVRIAEHGDKFLMPDSQWIYVTAYRPVSRKGEDLIDLWQWPLTIGAALPAVPLALKGYGCVRLDLEATYAEACARLRIPE